MRILYNIAWDLGSIETLMGPCHVAMPTPLVKLQAQTSKLGTTLLGLLDSHNSDVGKQWLCVEL